MALPNAVNGGSVTSSPSGTIVVIHAPAATVSGWQDYYITEENFLAAVNNSITAIDNRVSINEADIVELQDLGELDKSLIYLNTATTKVIELNSLIEYIAVYKSSGTPSVKVGTTLGGEDIVPNTSDFGAGVVVFRLDYWTGFNNLTLHITVSGGSCNFAFKLTRDLINTI